jgi:hypothetical protein
MCMYVVKYNKCLTDFLQADHVHIVFRITVVAKWFYHYCLESSKASIFYKGCLRIITELLLIIFFTAIGFAPDGSSPNLVQKQ